MKKLLFILFAVMSVASIYAAEDTIGVEAIAAPTDLTPKEFVWRSGKHFYQGDQLLTKHEYVSLLKNTSPEAFRQYKTGKGLIIAGWSVFGVGAGVFTIVGLGGFVGQAISYAVDPPDPDRPEMPGGILIGMFFGMPIGAGVMLLSTPLLAVGYSQRNKSVKTYNQCISSEPPITYNITAGQNGIGLAINF